MLSSKVKQFLIEGKYDRNLSYLYVCDSIKAADYRKRLILAVEAFEELYGTDRDISVFSAPGRTEICGNHTDHQCGRVLAASVNLDVIAIVSKNESNMIHIKSEGYRMDALNAAAVQARQEERNSSISLIRGIVAKFTQLGYPVGGFDAYTTSNVLSGSGLSSSAAFEVLVGTIINDLFCNGRESAVRIAQIGQYAENVYFNKPSGLMDQTASSVGGFVMIDFKDPETPKVSPVHFDFAKCGYTLCIIDTRGSHADLTPDYAAIPDEMKQVAAFFGKQVLSEVDERVFYSSLSSLRKTVGDRCILRAMHYYADNERVLAEVAALRENQFDAFLKLVKESGRSSYMYLQNVFSPTHVQEQGVSLALALCQRLLEEAGGAYRVHGGGFAGTIQVFVPTNLLPEFIPAIEDVLGKGACHTLSIRPVGGTKLI